MKNHYKINYLLFLLFGAIAGWFNVFAPLHEVWHLWFAIWSQGDPTMKWTSVAYTIGTGNTILTLSGFFGEVLLEAGLSLYFLNKGKFKLAGLLAGVLVSSAFYATRSTDFARYFWSIWGLHTAWVFFVSTVILSTLVITLISIHNFDTQHTTGR